MCERHDFKCFFTMHHAESNSTLNNVSHKQHVVPNFSDLPPFFNHKVLSNPFIRCRNNCELPLIAQSEHPSLTVQYVQPNYHYTDKSSYYDVENGGFCYTKNHKGKKENYRWKI